MDISNIKTYEDIEKIVTPNYIKQSTYNPTLDKLQLVLSALNDGCKFDLTEGNIWIPVLKFYKVDSVFSDNVTKIIGYFRYKNTKYALAIDDPYCIESGMSIYYNALDIGDVVFDYSLLACKSAEIANHISKYFGKLIFEACYLKHFKDEDFEWIEGK